MLLSGKPSSAGASWEGALCLTPRDFSCSSGSCGDPAADGHYGGAYAVCGSMSGTGVTAPNPNGTLPATGFWELQDYAHEVGHILGGHHTNCIALTPAEQGTTGRAWVDQCASDEYGCYSGDVFSPSRRRHDHELVLQPIADDPSRYIYGAAADMSHHELDDYLLHAGGTVGNLPNIVRATTPLTLSPISAPSMVAPSSTGNVASITAVSGALYSWSIANGSGGAITAGADTNSVTFTAPASGSVTLNVFIYNSGGCAGLTENTTISTGQLAATPTGLNATYNPNTLHIDLTWTQVSGSSMFTRSTEARMRRTTPSLDARSIRRSRTPCSSTRTVLICTG